MCYVTMTPLQKSKRDGTIQELASRGTCAINKIGVTPAIVNVTALS